ncbi:unnamed protein product [Rhizophagus irregularis]|nr:unnamed protein product [Rhizophagus irregularis]
MRTIKDITPVFSSSFVFSLPPSFPILLLPIKEKVESSHKQNSLTKHSIFLFFRQCVKFRRLFHRYNTKFVSSNRYFRGSQYFGSGDGNL